MYFSWMSFAVIAQIDIMEIIAHSTEIILQLSSTYVMDVLHFYYV